MNDSPDTPGEPRPGKIEYEDNHYHDEDEVVPVDDGPRPVRPPGSRKPVRRPPPRRPAHWED